MSDYILSCCSTADLTKEHFQKRAISYICFHYELDGTEYMDDLGESMPFDRFYAAMANGADTSPTEVQDCLMALPVEPGEHTLDMRYVPPGLIPGAAVSALAVLGCFALGFWERKKKTA